MRKLNFPIVRSIRLAHFSLYTLQDPIEFTINTGIICLAGANGLGKSTFLQVVNYALTGIVPRPGQKFASVDDYFRDVFTFAKDFFHGRILPEHKEIAEVELELQFGDTRVTICRGFVESDSLRSLTIDGQATDYAELTPEERQKQYEDFVVERVGLASFKEFVFIQSFVLTFDERRHLLFWDPKVLETCLFLFLGVDKEQRSEAERLRREMEKAESQVRNLVYDIKQQKDRLASLDEMLAGNDLTGDDAKTHEEYLALIEREQRAKSEAELVAIRTRDAKLSLAESASKASVLRNEYHHEFAARVDSRHSVESAPLVQVAVVEMKCGVCGADGPSIAEYVRGALSRHECPLCHSATQKTSSDPQLLTRLKELDKQLSEQKKNVDSSVQLIEQLEKEHSQRVATLEALQAELRTFEDQNKGVVGQPRREVVDHERIAAAYKDNIAGIERQRDKQKERSKVASIAYRQVQKALEQRYLSIRDEFVPMFSELANLFLGVDLDIQLEMRDRSVTVGLSVRNTQRRAEHDLSESQRFFIDIALRMALATYVSSEQYKAPLYVDTPEGSLDLAYEAQAGEMIAKFAANGHRVFMTANINSSELLEQIAKQSHSCGFSFQRLYKWRELSAIQERHEGGFKKRLDALELLAHPRKK